ncbi:hypothetical protein GALMADRAFT_232550 [Galerina marginata CBS 339.88]|uniref:BTB domain-containing protein n=1 Tax=Galerina marginata (strain CBS 339.88) TaxID=685588 RepID=A0A067S984_GALM3|nr:hypothetical protein GALMADRAFT_232550 [Galerina marginata CBS 339.88]
MEPPSHKTRVKTHDTHWFVDGNILLQIGQVRFRLHRSRLVAQSAWFKSLFERQVGILQGNEFEDQEEIDQAIGSAQVVDGLDLFYLDYPDGPTATEFAELLMAMDNAIEYLDDPPPFPVLQDVFVAAVFFRFRSFKRAMENSIEALFPDSVAEVTSAVIPHAVDAFNLGRTYAAVKGVVPRALYELARTPANFHNCSDEESTRKHPLRNLSADDLLLLMDIQKEFTTFWDTAIAIFATKSGCADPNCSTLLMLQKAIQMRKSYPLDPIVGLQHLIVHLLSSENLCRTEVDRISPKLVAGRNDLWSRLRIWSGVVEK